MIRRRGVAGVGLVALLGMTALGGCAAPERRLRRAANALDRDLQRGATAAVAARVHPRLAEVGAVDIEGDLGGVTAAQVTTMVEVLPGLVLPAVWTDDGWRFDADVSELFPAQTPQLALRSYLRAVDLERWEIVAQFAPREIREALTPEALERAWKEGSSAIELQQGRDLLRAGIDGPWFVDAHSATLVLPGDRAAHLEREGARWVV
ncbi:MAG: hypothetical protein ACPHRO_07735, partial [Nannocystaceae bacterium]